MKKSVFLAGAAALMILASCGGKKAEAPAAAEQPAATTEAATPEYKLLDLPTVDLSSDCRLVSIPERQGRMDYHV